MAARTNYFFRQKVTEAELDIGFELLEQADHNLAADIGLYGIVSGAEATVHSPVADLTVDLTAPARAYDRVGQRIFFGTGQRVDCSVDHSGIPTTVTVADRERWLGVFLRFDRLLSDPRTDGNSQQVYFRRDESFRIVVRQGPEGAIGSAPRVALQDDELLVCDVRRYYGQTQFIAADLSTARRQAFVFLTSNAVGVASALWQAISTGATTVQSALDSVDGILAGHLGGTEHKHTAASITSAARGFLSATNVQAALDELVDDLTASAGGAAGASRIGADAVMGTPHALAASNVDSQLSQLLGWLNAHVGASTGAHATAAIAGTAVTGDPLSLTGATASAQLSQLLGFINAHGGSTAGAHAASAISAAAHEHIVATTVQGQLEEIIAGLKSISPGRGAAYVGDAAISASPNALGAGTIRAQLEALLAVVNTHVWSTDHDARYYNKTSGDARYYRAGFQVDDADTVDGKNAADFAPASHNHDDRYLRIIFTWGQNVAGGATVEAGTLNTSSDEVSVGYAYVDPSGNQDPRWYFSGMHSADVRCWVTQVTEDTTKRFYINVMNNTNQTLYIFVHAYAAD